MPPTHTYVRVPGHQNVTVQLALQDGQGLLVPRRHHLQQRQAHGAVQLSWFAEAVFWLRCTAASQHEIPVAPTWCPWHMPMRKSPIVTTFAQGRAAERRRQCVLQGVCRVFAARQRGVPVRCGCRTHAPCRLPFLLRRQAGNLNHLRVWPLCALIKVALRHRHVAAHRPQVIIGALWVGKRDACVLWHERVIERCTPALGIRPWPVQRKQPGRQRGWSTSRTATAAAAPVRCPDRCCCCLLLAYGHWHSAHLGAQVAWAQHVGDFSRH